MQMAKIFCKVYMKLLTRTFFITVFINTALEDWGRYTDLRVDSFFWGGGGGAVSFFKGRIEVPHFLCIAASVHRYSPKVYSSCYFCHEVWAPAQQNKSPLSKCRGFGMNLLLDQNTWLEEMFRTKNNAAKSIKQLLSIFSAFSSPFFAVKCLYDYGLSVW